MSVDASDQLQRVHENAIVNGVLELSQQLDQLGEQLTSSAPNHWLCRLSNDAVEQQRLSDAIAAYSNIWHQGHGDGRLTSNLYGVIACSTATLDLATAINHTKDTLKQHITRFYSESKPLSHFKRQQHLNQLLERHHLSRLHLKQCYRHIPILDTTPDNISFSWYSNGRSIKRITTEEAQAQLLSLASDSSHIQSQLKLLESFASDTALAQVQPQAPLLRANLTWQTSSKPLRKARNCPLPFLIPSHSAFGPAPFPSIKPPVPFSDSQHNRLQRGDTKISEHAILPSIRVHLYER